MTFKQVLHRLNRRDTRLLPKNLTLSKLILILLTVVTITLTSKIILAETTTTSSSTAGLSEKATQQVLNKQAAAENGNNQESWSKELIFTDAMIGINILTGTIPEAVLKGEAKGVGWVPGGLIGGTSKAIAMTYNLPISGVQYLAQVKDNFFGKTAYAATGFQSMSPLIPVWKGFRNVTYVLFSVVFMIMGLMIMLRVKISPQATVTIQSTIPKIITSLILVTFSYAIVGLLIDFSYLITNLGVSIIYQATGDTSSVADAGTGLLGHVWSIANPINSFTITTGLVSLLGGSLGTIGSMFGFVLGLFSGIVAGTIGVFIILIFIFINIIKFFFALLKCYINILLKTIIGPLEIALGAIPNIKIGFGTWFVDILANIMVFPITTIVLVIIKKIMDIVWHSSNMWLPPGLDNNLWNNTNQLISLLIGFCGLLLLAKLPAMIPEFIFQIKPSPFGKAIGEGFKPIGGAFGGATKLGLQTGAQKIYDKWDSKYRPPSVKRGKILTDWGASMGFIRHPHK